MNIYFEALTLVELTTDRPEFQFGKFEYFVKDKVRTFSAVNFTERTGQLSLGQTIENVTVAFEHNFYKGKDGITKNTVQAKIVEFKSDMDIVFSSLSDDLKQHLLAALANSTSPTPTKGGEK